MEKNKRKDYLFQMILLAFGIITIVGVIKSLFISSDIDEGYAIAQSYRLLQGDKLVLNMWEPHQLSAYLSAIFMKIYLLITHSTTSIVIYLRIVGSLIHFGLGMLLYYEITKETNRKVGAIGFFLHMNYLAKWLTVPEFELMSYWLLLGAFYVIRKYERTKKNGWILALGAMIFLQMLNYPTMIILYPIYLYCLGKSFGWSLKAVMRVTLGAAIPGILFLIYLFSYMNMNEFLTGLAHITADPSHVEVSFAQRMMAFGKEFLWDSVVIGGVFFAAFLVCWKEKNQKKRVIYAFLIEIACFALAHMVGCVLFDQNQFFLQERYLAFCVFGIVLLRMNQKEQKKATLLTYGLLPTIGAVVAACLLSNMTLSVAYSKFFFCGMIVLMALFSRQKNDEEVKREFDQEAKGILEANGNQVAEGNLEAEDNLEVKDNQEADSAPGTIANQESFIFGKICYVPFILVLLGMFVCKILLIRVTGCLPVTIKAPLAPIEDGPAKGIDMLQEQATILNQNYALIKENVKDNDRLFYFGCENLTYLYTDAEICTASVQGTSVFNQDFLDYFELFPDKMPNVIVVDKSFEMIEAYRYSPWNYIVKDWILSREYEEVVEGDYLTIYRKQ